MFCFWVQSNNVDLNHFLAIFLANLKYMITIPNGSTDSPKRDLLRYSIMFF